MPELKLSGRAAELTAVDGERRISGWAAAEQAPHVTRALTGEGEERTLDAIVLGWMESIGPTTARGLSVRLSLPNGSVEASLIRLESQGQVLRGRFRLNRATEEGTIEWCHRRLLARIHRRTVGKLRKEIEPVATADFMRFLFQWQHVAPGSRQHGEAGLLEVVRQLAGFEAAASSWDAQLLRVRMGKYEPALLDRLCLSGAVSWGRLAPHPRLTDQAAREQGRRIMDWIILFLAGLFETGWAIGLKYTDGFTRLWPTVWTVFAMIISLWLLGIAVKSLPVGTAYSVWVGVGAVGTVVLGIVLLGEPANAARLISVGLIIAGIIGLKLASPA